MSDNPEVTLDLDEAVVEVLGQLTGLDLTYEPELDRYRAITRCLNRALRANALEHEWSWYADTVIVGQAVADERVVSLADPTLRTRAVGDDSVRLIDEDGMPVVWAYFLPRDAIHKYQTKRGLWVAITRQELLFSRPFYEAEDGYDIEVPVMREPTMFRLPDHPENPEDPLTPVPTEIREQPVDFEYPDVIVARAAYYYAQTDPVMQPRAQTLESLYKDLMYQVIERDDRFTDTPYQNEWGLGIANSLDGTLHAHRHPHSGIAERR